MKDLPLLLLSALLAAAAAVAASTWIASADASLSSARTDHLRATAEADARVAALEAELRELERFLAELPPASAEAAPDAGPADAVAAAVSAWLDEHAEALVGAGGAADGTGGRPLDPAVEALRAAPLAQLIDLVTDPTLDGDARQAAWERLAAAGRLAEVVGELERMVELDPQDPDLRVTLGNAYLQQLFQGASGPMAGLLAGKADAAFAAALQLDEGHWEARFLKAVSLSNWPAFLGKQGEAIAEFEQLVELQEQQTAEPQHAQTYLFLGNMQLETGDMDAALATWRRGLERFPASDELRAQLQRNGGGR